MTAPPPRRPWWEKKRWIAAAVVAAVAMIAGCVGLLFVLMDRAVSSMIH